MEATLEVNGKDSKFYVPKSIILSKFNLNKVNSDNFLTLVQHPNV